MWRLVESGDMVDEGDVSAVGERTPEWILDAEHLESNALQAVGRVKAVSGDLLIEDPREKEVTFSVQR